MWKCCYQQLSYQQYQHNRFESWLLSNLCNGNVVHCCQQGLVVEANIDTILTMMPVSLMTRLEEVLRFHALRTS